MDIDRLSIEEKAGQMLMFAFHGLEYNQQLAAFVEELNLGGVICFARNIRSVEQISNLNAKLQAKAKIPMFIGLDQEGGPVLRVMAGITHLPAAMALASTSREKIFAITKAVGSDLKHLGFNLNFAPVGDINNNPANPVINSRSYSDDPLLVSQCSEMAFKGFQAAKVLPTIKHFPGHGNTSVDSHLGLPIVDLPFEEVMKVELVPFINAINKGIDGVMMSHILYKKLDDQYPASLSKKIVTELLIDKLGFSNLIITDSLTMGAIYNKYTIEEILYHGVNAGCDILVFCGRADLTEQRFIYQTLVGLIKSGRIELARINKSVEKILRLKEKYVENRIDIGKINLEKNNEMARKLQEGSITIVRDTSNIPLKKRDRILILFPKINLFSLVDNKNQEYDSLGKYLAADEIIYDQDSLKNKKIFAEIIEKQTEYDKIIMATYNVSNADYQVELFDKLDKEKVIVTSLRSPYDILHLEGCRTYLCVYEATKESLFALSRVLKGESKARGKLPIKL